MPSEAGEKTERRLRSKSPGRRRSRSRSRSRGRSKSPARKGKQSPTRSSSSKSGTSPARPRKSRSEANTPKATSTPVRRSARLEEKIKDFPDGDAKSVTKSEQMLTKESLLKPRPHYEFGGPFGTSFLILALPALTVFLNDMCNQKSCDIRKLPSVSTNLKDYFNVPSLAMFVGWLAFQAVLAVLPIGHVVEGQPRQGGKPLKYRCNGLLSLLVTGLAFAGSIYMKLPLGLVYTNLRQLCCTATMFSLLLSVYLYVRARNIPAAARNSQAQTGCFPYDFFLGREMNPRMGPLDLKFFLEMRVGLMSWALITLSLLWEAHRADNLNTPMALLAGAQLLYIADALLFEDSILSTMDMTTDGLGFMLTFGNAVFVPFLFSLQTRYHMEHPVHLPYWSLALITLLNVVGYLIFRGSNSQKDLFRREPGSPSVAHLETLPTTSGRNLLVSGWWGLCRHPNYLGDLIMATAWSLYCGFGSVLPYFYLAYLLVFLVHRQYRDSTHCRQKHGAAWIRYCQRVPYKIVPYVY